MSILTRKDYLDYINTMITPVPVCRIELLDSDENVISNAVYSGRVINGSLSVEKRNGVRRTCNITFRNDDKALSPNQDLFWINQKFALYLGYKINGTDYMIRQGVFVASNPVVTTDGAMIYMQIKGQDKWALLDGTLGGRLSSTAQIVVDTDVNFAVNQILSLSEINDPKTPFTDPTTETTPYDIYADDRLASSTLLQLALMLSRNVYYDEYGILNMRNDISDTVKAPLFRFNSGNNGMSYNNGDNDRGNRVYLGGSESFDYEHVYNAVTVIGDNINGELFSYTAENRNNASPIAIGVIGYKLAPIIEDNNIYNQELVERRANYELTQVSRLVSSIDFTCLPIFHLDVDNLCTITDSELGLDNEELLINSFTINFGANPTMSINATRTQELLFNFDT